MRRALGAGIIALLGALVVGACALTTPRDQGVESAPIVAYVNDEPITRAEYETYLAVLSAAGTQAIQPWQVVQSLVNQRLAVTEAHDLGYAVTDSDLDRAIASMAQEAALVDLPTSPVELTLFRERLRVRMLFEQVKARVTQSVRATDDDIRRYLATYAPLYANTDWSAAKAEVEPAVRETLVAEAWSNWLARKRACARIEILMPNVTLAPAAAGTAC